MFLTVEFDDCAGNEDVTFEVSDPSFHVDGNLNLVPLRDVLSSGPVLFIQGVSAHADDIAQVDVIGHSPQSANALRVSRIPSVCLQFPFLRSFIFIENVKEISR